MMTTSQTSLLAKPVEDQRISERTLGYVTEMAREEVFNLIAGACIEAGASKSVIARRLGKDPAQISRLMGAPGNWTIDTIAELLFAIDGHMLRVSSFCPLSEAKANDRFPKCLDHLSETVVHSPNVKSTNANFSAATKTTTSQSKQRTHWSVQWAT